VPDPLAGIRVLDFTWVVAGPVTTRILADLGADVIKIERKDALDFGDRRGGLSGSLMRGKRSVALDLRDPRGVAIARPRLALRRPRRQLQRRVEPRAHHATLSRDKPEIVCVRMTGYGLTGPDRDKVSYGPTLQALTGHTMLMAEPETARRLRTLVLGPASGHGRARGTGRGLRAPPHGRGQLVDLAQLEAVASLLGRCCSSVPSTGPRASRLGNASVEGDAAPHGIDPCAGADRWIAITVFSDAEWRGLVAAMGRPAWALDATLAGAAGRIARRAALDEHLAAWTRTMNPHVATSRLQANGVPAGLVADAADVCLGDPALVARGHFVDVATPEGRAVRIDGPPFVLSETPGRVRGPGPLLGEHGDQVLREILGYDDPAIAALRNDGVLV
jgi:benzylsuccinate CoA-transferase BbsF subunit